LDLAIKYKFEVEYWGEGRISLYIESFETLQKLMLDPLWSAITRKCNHWLMQKSSPYIAFHNFALAQAIFEGISSSSLEDNLLIEDQNLSSDFYEGQKQQHLITLRQRNKKLVHAAKTNYKNNYGALSCSICGFNFANIYGDIGEDFIEAHHLIPLSDTDSTTTKLEDIALVCSNCHRMLHRKTPPYTPDELRQRIHSKR
jgi:predicted HNH restriction endonuclease